MYDLLAITVRQLGGMEQTSFRRRLCESVTMEFDTGPDLRGQTGQLPKGLHN